MRELLISLAIKYQGNIFKIRKALKNNEQVALNELPKAITIVDSDYPLELLNLKYPPYVLFYEGNKELLKTRKISIVGSRKMCEYGKHVTIQIVNQLNDKYTMVSGLAKGIDSIVHQNAKDTIAVVGNGLDIRYPKENEWLYEQLFTSQLVLSEYPKGVAPTKENFPFRNRIIAALGESLVVTQAAKRSGTMLTVNSALELGKEVYTVPYRLYDIEGAGCNILLQQGANMIVSR